MIERTGREAAIMNTAGKAIALEAHLRDCKNVITLGVRPNFSDYDEREIGLIRNAKKIYYPSAFYADMFDAIGKPTFPGYHNYKCVQDKIKQTAMFELLEIPHPRTRVYYGKRQNDLPADVRIAFVDFVEHLRIDEAISETLAYKVTL